MAFGVALKTRLTSDIFSVDGFFAFYLLLKTFYSKQQNILIIMITRHTRLRYIFSMALLQQN